MFAVKTEDDMMDRTGEWLGYALVPLLYVLAMSRIALGGLGFGRRRRLECSASGAAMGLHADGWLVTSAVARTALPRSGGEHQRLRLCRMRDGSIVSTESWAVQSVSAHRMSVLRWIQACWSRKAVFGLWRRLFRVYTDYSRKVRGDQALPPAKRCAWRKTLRAPPDAPLCEAILNYTFDIL